MEPHKKSSPAKRKELLAKLKARFENHRERHLGLEWDTVEAKLTGTTRYFSVILAFRPIWDAKPTSPDQPG